MEFDKYEDEFKIIVNLLNEKNRHEQKTKLSILADTPKVQYFYHLSFPFLDSKEITLKSYSSVIVQERKNHVSFERRGLSYRRYPTYKDKKILLGTCTLIITNRSIYIYRERDKLIIIKISNIFGCDIHSKNINIRIKTTSPIPHEIHFYDSMNYQELFNLVKCLV